MISLPIVCSGGIGDVLQVIGCYPLKVLVRLGVKPKFFYLTPEHPAKPIVYKFVNEIKNLTIKDKPTRNELYLSKKLYSLFARSKTIHAPPFVKRNPNSKAQNDLNFKILLHTHLDGHHGWKGASAKLWNVESWVELAEKVSARTKKLGILEWDDDCREQLLRRIPNAVDARGTDLMETIFNISTYSSMVSIDSWTKYVAAWFSIKQTIIVPDLRTGYCGFESYSADQVARLWFRGLTDSKNVKLIGLEKIGKTYEYTLPSLQHIDIERLANLVNLRKNPNND
jgi:hypothetical protein